MSPVCVCLGVLNGWNIRTGSLLWLTLKGIACKQRDHTHSTTAPSAGQYDELPLCLGHRLLCHSRGDRKIREIRRQTERESEIIRDRIFSSQKWHRVMVYTESGAFRHIIIHSPWKVIQSHDFFFFFCNIGEWRYNKAETSSTLCKWQWLPAVLGF